MWLWTDLMSFSVAPCGAISWKWIGRKCSPTMWRPEVGSRWWMSATRPASEFSIGIMARSASPLLDRGEAILEGRAGHRLGVGIDLAAGEVRIGAGLALEHDLLLHGGA